MHRIPTALYCLALLGPTGTAQQAGTPEALFQAAVGHQTSGDCAAAVSEYREFLDRYPEDKNTIRAWFNIGNCRYVEQKYEEAAQPFETAIDKYPVDLSLTPRALFMKGMSLKPIDVEAAVAAWRELLEKYPHADDVGAATEQLRRLGR